MDYLVYYGMTHNPFDKTAPKVIETVDFKELNVRLKYLTDVLGIGLVTGRPGAGKTVILREYARRLNEGGEANCPTRRSFLPHSVLKLTPLGERIDQEFQKWHR